MKLALSAGHNGIEQGVPAYGPQRLHEAELTALLCWRILSHLGASQEVYIVPQVSLSDKISAINIMKPALAVEVHLNAFHDIEIHGSEVLYMRDSDFGKSVAHTMAVTIADAFRRDRGVKARGDLAFLRDTRCPAIILELGFISNDGDRSILQGGEGQDFVADRTALAITRGLSTLEALNTLEEDGLDRDPK